MALEIPDNPQREEKSWKQIGPQPEFIIIQFNNHLTFPNPSLESVENYSWFKLFSVTYPERRRLRFKVSRSPRNVKNCERELVDGAFHMCSFPEARKQMPGWGNGGHMMWKDSCRVPRSLHFSSPAKRNSASSHCCPPTILTAQSSHSANP